MQSRTLRTYPSRPLGLYAAMEWGLGNIKFLSPFSFCGSRGGKTMDFHVVFNEYDEVYDIDLPEFNEQFLILLIPNKPGDNTVVLSREDCKEKMGKKVSMAWVATRIKRKWTMNLSRTSTTTMQE